MRMNDDLISRQEVFDALNGIKIPRNATWYQYYRQALDEVGCLPTISKVRTADDCISRMQAIDAVVGCTNCETETVLRAYVTKHSLENGWTGGIVDALDAIEQLPSIQPECPKGRWIPTASGKGRHECSRCHEYAPCYQDGSEHLSTFCVLCGAKMGDERKE